MNPDPDPSPARAPWLALDVIVDAKAWTENLNDLEAFARETIEMCLSETKASSGSLSILFASDADLQTLNLQFRQQDKPTNVLSFPSLSSEDGLGDVAIAFETTAKEALEQGKDFRAHARHLIAHGTLHLLGYDHEEDSEAEKMEDLERRILARFGVPDPYAFGPSHSTGVER